MIIGAALGGASAAISGQPIWKGIVIGAIGGALTGGAASVSTDMAVVTGTIVGAGSSAAMGGDPLLGGIMGFTGAGMGTALGQMAGGLGSGAGKFLGGLGAAALTGAFVGMMATEDSFGDNIGIGAAFAAVGYAASVAANKAFSRSNNTAKARANSGVRPDPY